MKPGTLGCSLMIGTALLVAPLFAKRGRGGTADAQHHAARRAAPAQTQDDEQEGQRVFAQNCARCHNAPDGFSQRITGTIVRHMRVRANLSRHDEEVLLHYFNP